MSNNSYEQSLAKAVMQYYDDPLGFVYFAYPWGEGILQGFNPDKWHIEFLQQLGEEVKKRNFNGVDAVEAIRFATASGHGIGKSCLTSWIIHWILSTRPFAKGVVTAATSPQLESKTWAELNKWTKICICGHWFEISSGKGNMKLAQCQNKASWRIDGITCKKENADSFAGLHAVNSTPFYIFDEASAVPNEIWEVAEGGLTDGEPMFFVFGNYTKNSGNFHECFNRMKHRWINRQIDSRSVKITNKKQIQKWVDDYGENSDFVRVRVRGLAPKQSNMQFISSQVVFDAGQREAHSEVHDPLVLGVDIARGGDDATVLFPRKGFDLRTIPYQKLNVRDTMQIVSAIQELHRIHKFDAIFIDATGIGAAVFDRCLQLGLPVIEVQFAAKSPSKEYANMRAYIWGKMKDALKSAALPDDSDLESELVSVEYFHTKDDKIILEPKEAMKNRGLSSPDIADSLAVTYAAYVEKNNYMGGKFASSTGKVETEYNPYEDHNSSTDMDYNPYSS